MHRITKLFALATIAIACFAGALLPQDPLKAPGRKRGSPLGSFGRDIKPQPLPNELIKLPEAKLDTMLKEDLRSAKLLFTNDGYLLVLRHYGNTKKQAPILSVHSVKRGKGGFFYPSLTYDLLGKKELENPKRSRFGRVSYRYPTIAAAISPDDKRFATTSSRTVRLWNARCKPVGTPLEHGGRVKAAFSPDGKRLLTASLVTGNGRGSKVTYTLQMWDAQTGKPIGQSASGRAEVVQAPFDLYSVGVKALLWMPDGKAFLTVWGGNSKKKNAVSPQLWDAATLKPIGLPLPAVGDFYQLTPDGKKLLVISTKETSLWDVAGRRLLSKLSTAGVYGIRFPLPPYYPLPSRWFAAHAGTHVLYAKPDQVELWNMDAKTPQKKQVLKQPRVYWMAISRDGKRAGTASWDTLTALRQVVAVSRDGKQRDVRELRSIPTDDVIVWDLDTGKPLIRVPVAPMPTIQNAAGLKPRQIQAVKAMEFSPDGRLLAIVDGMGGVRLWNVDAGK